MRSAAASDDAVRALDERAYPRLVSIVGVAAGNRGDAEEVVQEAFLRLLRRWPQVSQYDDPEAWVRMVAFRLLSNRARKTRNGITALLRHGASPPVDPPTTDHVDVAHALQGLPLPQRQVLVLHHLVGLDVTDVADLLDVPVGTVKSRLSRGRSALAPLLTQEQAHA
jgi:RNA polymerase sigma-70 factor (ECF subfamily)